MAQMLNKFLGLALLTCMSVAQATSIIIPRSQSVNAARELVGWQQFINKADMDCLYGAFSLTAEYQQSFRGARLMQCLFDGDIFLNNSFTSTSTAISTLNYNNSGCCDSNNSCNTSCNSNNRCNSTAALLVQGSCVANRNANAWLADYFGLPTDFNSVVTFRPKIQNAIFDFNLYLGFGEWGCGGGFFRIHAPIVWTKWNLCASEAVLSAATVGGTATGGTAGYFPGYMNTYTGIPASSLRSTFLSAIDGTYTFGDMQTPLRHGIFCGNGSNFGSGSCCGTNNSSNRSCNNGLVRLSDIEAAFGYNFVDSCDYHFGLDIRGSAPTGNKPCNVCLFEPIVGNGKFWTLGAGLTAHATLWRDCECPDRSLSFYIDANVTHLFKNCQSRSFDLAGKPNSRYMLVETLGAPSTTVPLFAGALTASTAVGSQYVPYSLQPLINVSTFNANVSYAAQGDIAMKLSYNSNNWELDLGYEFWGRTKEKVCLRANSFPANTYALKGDAFIYGFGASNSPVSPNGVVPLSATENNATIHSGTSASVYGTNGCATATSAALLAFNQNSGIDNRTNATLAATTPLAQVTYLPNLTATAGNAQFTSAPPVFLSAASFATCNGNSTYTNKVFANISYSWESCDCLSPFIGIGGEAEFASCGNRNGNNCGTSSSCGTSSCGSSTSCNNDSCAISQWGVWLKGGFGF